MLYTLLLLVAVTGEGPAIETDPQKAVEAAMVMRKQAAKDRAEDLARIKADIRSLRAKRMKPSERQEQVAILTHQQELAQFLADAEKRRSEGPTPFDPQCPDSLSFGFLGDWTHVLDVTEGRSVVCRSSSSGTHYFILRVSSIDGYHVGDRVWPKEIFVYAGKLAIRMTDGESFTVPVLTEVPDSVLSAFKRQTHPLETPKKVPPSMYPQKGPLLDDGARRKR